MRKVLGIHIILLLLTLTACEKVKYYPDKELENIPVRILAHRGGGDSGIQENTLEAAQYGLTHLDGIEVDIQLSRDRTIWLSHNAELPSCSGIQVDCFTEARDNEILELDRCLGNDYMFTTLEQVFAYISQNEPGKYISIDVKAWQPCDINTLDILGLLNVIAEEIIKLTEKYNLENRVMVESETATFLDFMKDHCSFIEVYLSTMGDFERGMLLALESGYSGISFKYKFDEKINVEHVAMLHKKGLKIQLWTVNTESDILEAISINPDFIQTDNISFAKEYAYQYSE